MFSLGAMVASNLNITLILRGKREKVLLRTFQIHFTNPPWKIPSMQCLSLSKNNEPLNFWIISCDYFAFSLLVHVFSKHACFDVCHLYSLVCCCRRSKDRGCSGGVHVGGKPGQHQLWGGGSPRGLGDLVQRRPPAALCQLHQLEDPQHTNQQLPGGLLHLPDIQKHNEAVFAINRKLHFLAGHICCQILLGFVSATAVVS